MSTSFYIGPIDVSVWVEAPDDAKPTSDLRIDAAAYADALSTRWLGLGIAQNAMSHCVLYWELPPESLESSSLAGQLFNDHQIVSFGTGPKRSFIDFILWHRTQVPDDVPLYLFHSTGWERLELTSQTTEQDILAFTGLVA
jgi:hypothetical protein